MTPKVTAKVSWKDSTPGGAIISRPSAAAEAGGSTPSLDAMGVSIDVAKEPGGASAGSPESSSGISRLQAGPSGCSPEAAAKQAVTGTPVPPHSCAKTVYGTPASDFSASSVLDNASFSSSPSTPYAMPEQDTPTQQPSLGSSRSTPTADASAGVPSQFSPPERQSPESARSPVSPDGIPGGPKALNLASPSASESATADSGCEGQGSGDEDGPGCGEAWGEEVCGGCAVEEALPREADKCGDSDREAVEFYRALQGSFHSPSPSGASAAATAGSVIARGGSRSGDQDALAASPLQQVPLFLSTSVCRAIMVARSYPLAGRSVSQLSVGLFVGLAVRGSVVGGLVVKSDFQICSLLLWTPFPCMYVCAWSVRDTFLIFLDFGPLIVCVCLINVSTSWPQPACLHPTRTHILSFRRMHPYFHVCARACVRVCACVCVYVMSFPRAAARFSRAYNSSQQSTTTRKPCALRKT